VAVKTVLFNGRFNIWDAVLFYFGQCLRANWVCYGCFVLGFIWYCRLGRIWKDFQHIYHMFY